MEAHGHGLHIPGTFLLTKSIEISRKQNHKDVQRFSQGSQHFNIFQDPFSDEISQQTSQFLFRVYTGAGKAAKAKRHQLRLRPNI